MPVKRANAVLLALGVSFGILPYLNAEVLPYPKPREQYLILEKFQNEANSKPGPRHVPEKLIPVPKTASARVQELTSSPYQLPKWTANHPVTPDDWKRVVEPAAQATIQKLPELHKKLGVVVNKTKVGGVPAYEIVPKNLPPENATRILLHIHGGGFTYNPGEAGTLEAILMAAYGGYKVISVDYRLAPDHPYPAALDDVTNAYKYIISKYPSKNVAVFGSSAGGNLTLALMLRARDEGLTLPGAMAPGTPWSDISRAGGGDTIETLEWIGGNLVSYSGYISHAAAAYANGHDLNDPYLSPIRGDFKGLPPAILTTGTRDLFLSLTAMTHRKLKQAGVEADLEVYEGMAHAQYFDPWAPESKEVFSEIGKFFNIHLSR